MAFKFHIDRAKERHKSSKIGYVSYIDEATILKIQTFASCCPSIAKSNYPGSQYSTCIDLSTHPDNVVYDLLLMRILPRTEDGVRKNSSSPQKNSLYLLIHLVKITLKNGTNT